MNIASIHQGQFIIIIFLLLFDSFRSKRKYQASQRIKRKLRFQNASGNVVGMKNAAINIHVE